MAKEKKQRSVLGKIAIGSIKYIALAGAAFGVYNYISIIIGTSVLTLGLTLGAASDVYKHALKPLGKKAIEAFRNRGKGTGREQELGLEKQQELGQEKEKVVTNTPIPTKVNEQELGATKIVTNNPTNTPPNLNRGGK